MVAAPSPLRFHARTQSGESKGRVLGFPTINFRLDDVPPSLMEGIYACRVTIDGRQYDGALHYGPRPAVQAGASCEVHLLDTVLIIFPDRVEIEIVARLRDVLDFPTPAALAEQIAKDVDHAREILRTP